LSNWGHRVVTATPPWEIGLHRCFAWWAEEHAGKGVARAHVSFEHEPWDALSAPPGPPGAPVEVLRVRGLEELRSWRSPLDITLRVLRGDADWQALVDLDVRVNGWQTDLPGQEYLRWSRGERRRLIEGGRGVQMGAFASGRLVGGAALIKGGREARFQEVSVDPAFRRRGIATALVGSLARDARERRAGLPLWITATAGSQADRIYERLGFQPRSTMWSWAIDAPLGEDEIATRWAALRASTLPTEQWHHRDHLWGAVCVLREHDVDVASALDDFRDIITRFLAAHGIETTLDQGYHETLTRGWLEVVAAQMRQHPEDTFMDAALRAQLAFSDKRYLLRYWSRDLMMSQAARESWVEPDLDRVMLDG